jgi:hypothetical protein
VVSLWVAATVAPDGGARITEVIDWDFGPNERHGIVRDLPGLRLSAPVEVSSPDAPDAVDISPGGTPRIRIGDPDRTVRGLHRYVVSYTVDAVVRDGRLAWDAVGTTWTAPIENTEIHVTAPTELDGAACTTGTEGSQHACDIRTVQPGHLVARVGELDAGDGVTVSATTGAALGGPPPVPAPPVAAPARQGVDAFLPGLLAGVIALLAAGLGSLLILRVGRESVPTMGVPLTGRPGGHERIDLAELAGYAVPSPSLPAGLSPAEGGVLLAGRVLDRHKAAWLIDQAVAGVVDLTREGTSDEAMGMVRLRSADPAVGRLLDIAFRGRDRVTLGGYDGDRWAGSCRPGRPAADCGTPTPTPTAGRAGFGSSARWSGWPARSWRSSAATSPQGRPVFPWCSPVSVASWREPVQRAPSAGGRRRCSPPRGRQRGCGWSRSGSSSRSRRPPRSTR